ncbi:MAG TPA: hypothetical protein VFE60_00335 [Roseiarcus sp.]|nr:hypothetical protein [Roseiarcus sp.]
MSHTHVHDRIREAKAAAAARKLVDDGKIVLFWLEFSDPDTGEGLGTCIVPAEKDDFIGAVRASHYFKANPGGQCVWLEVENLDRTPRSYLARLLSKDEADALLALLRGVQQ